MPVNLNTNAYNLRQQLPKQRRRIAHAKKAVERAQQRVAALEAELAELHAAIDAADPEAVVRRELRAASLLRSGRTEFTVEELVADA